MNEIDWENLEIFVYLDGETPDDRQDQAFTLHKAFPDNNPKETVATGCEAWRRYFIADNKKNAFLCNFNCKKAFLCNSNCKEDKTIWINASDYIKDNNLSQMCKDEKDKIISAFYNDFD